MSQKVFVLDTNVLIHDSEAVMKFEGREVVIPLVVVEELDQLKRSPGQLGKSARQAIRVLDQLSQRAEEGICRGCLLDNGSRVRIETASSRHKELMDLPYQKDNLIIMTALAVKERGARVVFVSKDLAARIKANSFGLQAQDYENMKVAYDRVFSGYWKLPVSKEQIDQLRMEGSLNFDPFKELLATEEESRERFKMVGSPIENEYYHLVHEGDKGVESLICYYSGHSNKLKLTESLPKNIWGISPRNPQQHCALDLLLDDSIQLVNLVGTAGTGKTLLALAAALRKVFDEMVYHRILVSRPIVPLGNDVGYLPGTKEEKLSHWMQPIFDNLEFLCQGERSDSGEDVHSWIMSSKKIEMEAVTYIRGRSLPKVFLIVDEAQNLTPHEVKTVISRAGEGTKVVLTGDPTQIDHPYLDRDFNALTYTAQRFKNQPLFGHIRLHQSERSQLAALCAELM